MSRKILKETSINYYKYFILRRAPDITYRRLSRNSIPEFESPPRFTIEGATRYVFVYHRRPPSARRRRRPAIRGACQVRIKCVLDVRSRGSVRSAVLASNGFTVLKKKYSWSRTEFPGGERGNEEGEERGGAAHPSRECKKGEERERQRERTRDVRASRPLRDRPHDMRAAHTDNNTTAGSAGTATATARTTVTREGARA